ncbi:MAG: hypothetical protein Q4E55_04390 [Bacteroidales bacterium]|nr:hypothetical protein [Bacteroidales bacterium]
MKKLTFIVLVCVLIALPACKNQKKSAESSTATTEVSQQDQQTIEALKVNVQELIASAKKIKLSSFATASKEGKIQLSDKEKMVKPNYLLSPSVAADALTLSQKYRTVAMLLTDKSVAKMYDMPTNEYDVAINKLMVDINDNALTSLKDVDVYDVNAVQAAFAAVVDAEYEAGRANNLWEGIAVSTVEKLFVITRNVDKFMPMFTDESAADITYRFVLVHDGIQELVNNNEEMKSLNEVLAPLYKINAMNVKQLRDQLTELKGQIEEVRKAVLK